MNTLVALVERALAPRGTRLGSRTERTSRHETAVKRVLILLFFFVNFNGAQTICTGSEYLNATSGSCQACTDCLAGRIVLTPCSGSADTVCSQIQSDCTSSSEVYNAGNKTCEGCTECALNEQTLENCRIDQDTRCLRKCADNFVYQEHLDSCTLDCTQCPQGVCRDQHHCLCEPAGCYEDGDIYCHFRLCEIPEDCTSGSEFYNSSSKTCEACTECALNEQTLENCRIDQDTRCLQKCADNFVYQEHLYACTLDCTQCPQGLCRDQHHCLCEPAGCYEGGDIYCQHSTCTEMPENSTTSGSTSEDQNSSLQSWNIGLMAAAICFCVATVAVPT